MYGPNYRPSDIATTFLLIASAVIFAFVLTSCVSVDRQQIEDIIDTASEQLPPPDDKPAPDRGDDGRMYVDISPANPLIEWWAKSGENCATWPVVGKTVIRHSDRSGFNIDTEPGINGKNNVVYIGVWRDGRWICGGFEGIGNKNGTGKSWKMATKAGIIGRYGPESEEKDRAKARVKDGDTIFLGVMSKGNKTRTKPVLMQYPNNLTPSERPDVPNKVVNPEGFSM